MNKDTLKKWADNPWKIADSFSRRGWLNWLPDKAYLSLMYRASFNKKMNWKDPKTFNEKLQWLKLFDRNPSYCEMVDKYIDDALRAGVKTIRIVHGKGTGVLRRRVTEYLKTDTRVLSVRIGEWGEGDTGVSIAELR